jgi:hypothetical protein
MEPRLEPLAGAECPAESPLRALPGCPLAPHAQVPGGECAEPATALTLTFDDSGGHPEDVRAVAREGLAKFEQGDYPDACQRFSLAFERTTHFQYAFALASCEKELGQNLGARQLFRAIAAAAPAPAPEKLAPMQRKAERALRELEQGLAQISIRFEREDGEHHDGLDFTLDRRRLSPALLGTKFELDAGTHEVEIWARCYEPGRLTFDIHGGEHRDFTLEVRRLRRR